LGLVLDRLVARGLPERTAPGRAEIGEGLRRMDLDLVRVGPEPPADGVAGALTVLGAVFRLLHQEGDVRERCGFVLRLHRSVEEVDLIADLVAAALGLPGVLAGGLTGLRPRGDGRQGMADERDETGADERPGAAMGPDRRPRAVRGEAR